MLNIIRKLLFYYNFLFYYFVPTFSVHVSGCPHECMFCLEGFQDFETMQLHTEQHNNKHQCKHCSKQFDDFAALGAHSITSGCYNQTNSKSSKTPAQNNTPSPASNPAVSSPRVSLRSVGLKRKLACAAVEREIQTAYLSCPKAKLRYECPLCRQNLGPNKLSFVTHLQLHSGSHTEDQVQGCIKFSMPSVGGRGKAFKAFLEAKK